MILRKATTADAPVVWEILQQAIEQRRQDGSEQWQDGYPNEKSIAADIAAGCGYVLEEHSAVLAYAAIISDKEPAYEAINGKWLTDGDYLVVHRVAVSNSSKGKGIATKLFAMIEDLAVRKRIYSIKVDTNFDNAPMLRIFEKLGYSYCGEVFFRGSARKAFEKVLSLN